MHNVAVLNKLQWSLCAPVLCLLRLHIPSDWQHADPQVVQHASVHLCSNRSVSAQCVVDFASSGGLRLPTHEPCLCIIASCNALCREGWSQQVATEQKQLAQESAEARRGLEAARTAELAAHKAALEFEARAKLAQQDVGLCMLHMSLQP